MTRNVDFVISDHVQRIEMWRSQGARAGFDMTSITRSAQMYAAAVLVPVCGNAYQKHGTTGFEPDGFMLGRGSARFYTRDAVREISVTGWLPEQHGRAVDVELRCAGERCEQLVAPGTLFTLALGVDLPAGIEDELHVAVSSTFVPSAASGSGDNRHLGCIIVCAYFA